MHGKNDALKELIVKVAKKNKKDLKEDADDIIRRLVQVSSGSFRWISISFNPTINYYSSFNTFFNIV